MFKSLKKPSLSKRLEFGNDNHIETVRLRQLCDNLSNMKTYMRWRRELKAYDWIVYNISENEEDLSRLYNKFCREKSSIYENIREVEDIACRDLGLEWEQAYKILKIKKESGVN